MHEFGILHKNSYEILRTAETASRISTYYNTQRRSITKHREMTGDNTEQNDKGAKSVQLFPDDVERAFLLRRKNVDGVPFAKTYKLALARVIKEEIDKQRAS
jgi:hypothetical protein